jgi:hypothetical protein
MIKIINQKLVDAVFKYDDYEPNDLVQYLTCENFEEKYYTYMYTNGEYYYYFYLSIGLICNL